MGELKGDEKGESEALVFKCKIAKYTKIKDNKTNKLPNKLLLWSEERSFLG